MPAGFPKKVLLKVVKGGTEYVHAGIFCQDCPSFVLAFNLRVELGDYGSRLGMWWEAGRGEEAKKGGCIQKMGDVKPSERHVNVSYFFLYPVKASEYIKRPVTWNALRVFTYIISKITGTICGPVWKVLARESYKLKCSKFTKNRLNKRYFSVFPTNRACFMSDRSKAKISEQQNSSKQDNSVLDGF